MLCMSQETLKMVHYSYFHTITNYILIFWGNSPRSKNMFTRRKNIIRIIMGRISGDSWRNLFKKLRILPLQTKYALPVLFMVSNGAGPRLVSVP